MQYKANGNVLILNAKEQNEKRRGEETLFSVFVYSILRFQWQKLLPFCSIMAIDKYLAISSTCR